MKDGAITYKFADGEYVFRLAIGELREMQERCTVVCPLTEVVIASGFPLLVYKRLQAGEWAVNDVTEVIRLGLIGGGTKPPAALSLVARYVEPHLATYATLALVVLGASLSGGFDSEAGGGKKPAAAAEPPPRG